MWDVIVVGAGSSGCAVAARLSEDPGRRVLLLEAGGDGRRDPRIALPSAFVALHHSRRDWAYRTEPQRHLGGRRLHWPRGRVLGGSSATNYLVYLRGHPGVYDGWADAGCDGWSHDDLLPAFKRLEDHPLGPSRWHGRGGPVRVSDPAWDNGLSDAFVEAAVATGVARSGDLEGEHPEGAGRYRVTVRDGRRESSATAYLTGAAALTVRTDAVVTRVLHDGDTASGVELRDGEHVRARAVVLAGGAVGSPALLMHSGIGPAADLRRAGIDAALDRPEVGGNLADHLLVPVVYAAPPLASMPGAALNPLSLARYALGRSGPLASNVADAGAIVRSTPDRDLPDLQITFGAASIANHGRSVQLPSLSLGAVGLLPRSRGRMWLRSADPAEPPAIDPDYLSDADDLRVLRDGVRLARRIAAEEPLASSAGREREPGAGIDSDAAIDAWIARRAQTSYHPVGTCRMGADVEAVVDPRLRLRGVDGLWVADASVMPQIPCANTNAACLMIGERAADLLREDLER